MRLKKNDDDEYGYDDSVPSKLIQFDSVILYRVFWFELIQSPQFFFIIYNYFQLYSS